ncbi:unnamed protein product, partial [Brenthis ino]
MALRHSMATPPYGLPTSNSPLSTELLPIYSKSTDQHLRPLALIGAISLDTLNFSLFLLTVVFDVNVLSLSVYGLFMFSFSVKTNRSFDGSIDFRGLEEAIEYILNEEGDPDVSYDLVAIPLDPSIITNKEEGGEDDVL